MAEIMQDGTRLATDICIRRARNAERTPERTEAGRFLTANHSPARAEWGRLQTAFPPPERASEGIRVTAFIPPARTGGTQEIIPQVTFLTRFRNFFLRVEGLLRWIGQRICNFYEDPKKLLFQGIASYILVLCCVGETLVFKKSPILNFTVAILLITNVLAGLVVYLRSCGYNLRLSRVTQNVRRDWRSILFVGQSTMAMLVFMLFDSLTEEIVDNSGVGLLAFSSFVLIFINLTSVMKLMDLEDFCGISDGIIALMVYLVSKYGETTSLIPKLPSANGKSLIANPPVNSPAEDKPKFTVVSFFKWVLVFFMELFKLARIHPLEEQPELPVSVAAQLPLSVVSVARVRHQPYKGVCKYWRTGHCLVAQCQYLHMWSSNPDVELLSILKKHKKEITGITVLEESGIIYSASIDGTLIQWQGDNGSFVLKEHDYIAPYCLFSFKSWVFVGVSNCILAFHVPTNREYEVETLGKVNAITMAGRYVFTGTSKGTISVWNFEASNTHVLKLQTKLQGHNDEVTSLVTGPEELFSGSCDNTIRVWDLRSLQCKRILSKHGKEITSLIYWNQSLLSSSLDGTINLWERLGRTDNWITSSTYNTGQSVHSLCHMNDANGRPILIASYQDGGASFLELPLFTKRGKIHSASTISVLMVHRGFLFTGDKAGEFRVWKLLP